MELREYQKQLIQSVRLDFKEHKRILAVAPCGSGKTIMFAYMCNEHLKKNKSGYVWFLVHRQELIEQTINTFSANHIDTSRVLIAMVQTVSRHIDTYTKPSMIIFDEAHHSTANTWNNILLSFPDTPVIGLTATPCRLNGESLGKIYQSMQVGVSANRLIAHNYLAPYDYYAPHINLEDAKFEVKGSDYDTKDVESKLDKSKIYGDIFKYIDLERKSIVYCPTVAFSNKIVDLINSHYSKRVACHFDGNTPKSERAEIISKFRSGEIRILSNVDLIGEGFDVPDCDCIFLLRPTMSTALYIQQSMRCLRYQPNKKAVIYDFVGNVFRHGMPSDNHEWNLKTKVKMKNTSTEKELVVRECKSCFRVYRGTNPICPYCGANNGKTRKQIEQERKADLEKIENIQKKKERSQVGMCQNFGELVELGRKRGYKNAVGWAYNVMRGRNNV